MFAQGPSGHGSHPQCTAALSLMVTFLFIFCPYVYLVLVNTIIKGRLEGIPSFLAQLCCTCSMMNHWDFGGIL